MRLKSNMPRQSDLAQAAKMHQSRISMFETPGASNLTLDTLSRLAAAFRVGLKVEFVPFSDMLRWENGYSQDTFSVTKIDDDIEFLQPTVSTVRKRPKRKRTARRILSSDEIFQTPMATGGVGASTYMIRVQQERVQLRLQFKPSESAPSQDRLADVITLPNRRGSVVNDLSNLRAAAGAGGHYGN